MPFITWIFFSTCYSCIFVPITGLMIISYNRRQNKNPQECMHLLVSVHKCLALKMAFVRNVALMLMVCLFSFISSDMIIMHRISLNM
jgi:hypothetical protein